jgi:G3E family GTPase
VDAQHGLREPESVKQAAAADRLVVTKGDLADPGHVERELARLNPAAEVLAVSFGEVEPELLFGGADRDPREVPEGGHSHEGDVKARCVFLDDELDWGAFGIWLTMLLQSRGDDILRVKGLLNVGGAGPLLLNGVQHVVHPPEHLEAWPDGDRRSRLVFIGRGIEPEALAASLHAFNVAAR